MRLPAFECIFPDSVAEATSFLEAHPGEARLLAGGTDLLMTMKNRLAAPKYLVNLKSVPGLAGITSDGVGLRIGALTTLSTIAESPVVGQVAPMLAQAARQAASPHLRNAGTLGGNLCLDSRCWFTNQSESWRASREACFKTGGDLCYVIKESDHCVALVTSDTAPALIALGASVELASARGTRVVPLESFYTGIGTAIAAMEAEEVLTAVQIPRQPSRAGGAYLKHARRDSIEFPFLGVGVALRLHDDGVCSDIRICVGAATPAPMRAQKAEAVLRGQVITPAALKEAAAAGRAEVRPIVNLFAAPAYKRHLVGVLIGRTVRQAADAAGQVRE